MASGQRLAGGVSERAYLPWMRRVLLLCAIAVAGILAASGSSAVGTKAVASVCASGKAVGTSCYPPCPLFPNWTSRTNGTVSAGATADGLGLTAKCVFDPASTLCDAVKGSCTSSTPPPVSLTFLVTFAPANATKTTVQGCSPATAVSGTTVTLSSYGQVANIQFTVDGSGANAVLFPSQNGAASTNLSDVEANILGNARAYLDAFNMLDKGCNVPVLLRFSAPLPPNPTKLGGRTTWPLRVTGGNKGTPITISGKTPKVCVLVRTGSTVTLRLVATGTCTVSARQAGAGGSVPATAGISFKIT